MASSDYGQLTTVVRRLGDQLSLLNPARLATAAAEVVREISEPPPGDPDALEALAAAYRTAAEDIRRVLAALGTAEPAVLAAVGRAPQVFRDAADALAELARSVREGQRRHAELHRALRDAGYDATHAFGMPLPDPSAVDDVVRAGVGLVRGGIEVYTASLDAADRAASRFADLTGRARAAAGVRGGLAPSDALGLAAATVAVAGVGDAYDDGVLTVAQLATAGRRLSELGPRDRRAFTGLLGEVGGPAERAWLYKAFAAAHGMGELSAFAEAIRGRDEAWLCAHLSLIDRGGAADQDRLGADVRQYEDTTCGTTSLIVARAEADPRYALSLTDGDFVANFAAERDRVHDETNVLWPEALGTSPAGMADHLTRHTGTRYGWRLVDDTDHRDVSATMRAVVTAADRGHPVPVLIGGPVPRHYVLVVGHSGGDVLIYEPSSGATVRVPDRDFLAGNLTPAAGFPHIQAVVVPD